MGQSTPSVNKATIIFDYLLPVCNSGFQDEQEIRRKTVHRGYC